MNAILLSMAVAQSLSFSHIDVSQNLPHNTVLSIVEDSQGYIWMGTANGVARFDGYEIVSFTSSRDNEHTLCDNLVNKLYMDYDGTIWACSSSGVSQYHPDTERFNRYVTPGRAGEAVSVTDIVRVSAGRMFVVSSRGSRILDTDSGIYLEGGVPQELSSSLSVLKTRDAIWIANKSASLLKCRFASDSITIESTYSLPADANAILEDKEGKLWCGTEGGGLIHIDPESGKHIRLGHEDGLSSNFVRALQYDMDGRLWIGTVSDLCILDPASGQVTVQKSDYFKSDSPSHGSVKSILRDSQGGMWLGTYWGGANYWHPAHRRFKTIMRTPSGAPLNDNIINCIVQDSDFSLWVGTNRGGINHCDSKSNSTRAYIPASLTENESNDIKTLYMDPDGRKIYCGSHGSGLVVIDKLSGRMTHVGPVSNIYSIVDAGSGKLWLGALGGLYLYDKSVGKMRKVMLPGNATIHILSMVKDSAGDLWIGAKEGVTVLHVGRGLEVSDITDRRLNPVSQISTLYESIEHKVYIGAEDALYCYDRNDSSIVRYTTANGLPDNCVRAIQQDNYGRLWLSTDKGLCVMSQSGDYIRTYTEIDGLPSRQMMPGALCMGHDGNLYAGTINGIAYFCPETMPRSSCSPVPTLTGLRVFDRKISPMDGTGILAKSISCTDMITLRHWQKHFTLTFATLNYATGRHNTFAWKLEGFDSDWHVGSSHEATYSNLGRGRYTFVLKSANGDGVWCDTPRTLSIRVKPVWYMSLTAQIIWCALLAASVAAFIMSLLSKQRRRSKDEMHRLAEEHEKQMDDLKAMLYICDKSKASAAGRDFMSRVISLVNDNLSDSSFGVTQLASMMHMSRVSFHGKLKDLTGFSALELIHRLRFDKACALLDDGRYSISQVSDMTGFSSPSWFTASFKRRLGLTPSEYIAKKKKEA